MWRHGETAKGTPRWWCNKCKISGVKTRSDISLTNRKKTFIKWILHMQPLSEIANLVHCSRKLLSTQFEMFWNNPPSAPRHCRKDSVLLLDGTWIGGSSAITLICSTQAKVRTWVFADRESYKSWFIFISQITAPDFAIVDGHGGLTVAIKHFWPDTHIQRCVAHIVRHAQTKLTRKPKTRAGRELKLLIVHDLPLVWTRRQKRRWVRRFKKWCREYDTFLKEKTYYFGDNNERRWWYKHRNLRGMKSHINNALPYLFEYVRHPQIPRTTNFLEGGINAGVKELLRRHRGLSLEKRLALVAYFLQSKLE